jgi:hypothetical protein
MPKEASPVIEAAHASAQPSERDSAQPPRQEAGQDAAPAADDKPARRIQRTRHPSRRGKVARRDP